MPKNEYLHELLKTAYTGRADLDFAGGYLTAAEHEAAEEARRIEEAVEERLTGRPFEGDQYTSVRELTDKARAASALPLPVDAGTRVSFNGNAGSLLTYEDPPVPGDEGVVVTVRSASGHITSHGGRVFVKWSADGKVRAIHAEHLRLSKGRQRRSTASDRIRVASLGDLTAFLKVSSDTLVHKATKDLWRVQKDPEGFVIERLFDDSGNPLKV